MMENNGPSDEKNFFPYMPGTEDVVNEILHSEAVRTIKEYDTDRDYSIKFWIVLRDLSELGHVDHGFSLLTISMRM